MGITDSKSNLCECIKNDDIEGARKILEKKPELLTEPLNQGRDTPGLVLACTYGSNKILNLFLDVRKI
jgi:hypothetical protein